MTKQEFEARTGVTCLNSTFEFINRIYMAAGEQDKDTFCKAWKDEMTNNSIVRELTETVEALRKELGEKMTVIANMGATINDQAKQMDNALRTQKSLNSQLKYREAEVGRLRRLVDATFDEINLGINDKLRETFELHLGKVATMRRRKAAGWTLAPADIDWLLDHADEDEDKD